MKINVIVKSINIGLMTLIGMGVLALVTAVIFVILLYIALTKPFRGTISAQSYCNGVYRGLLEKSQTRPGKIGALRHG